MHEIFEHTADIGLRIRAASLEELFSEAAVGLFSLVVPNLDQVKCIEKMDFTIAGRTGEHDYLLFDWLNELLFAVDSKRVLLAEFDVHFTETGLTATACGEPFDPARHRLEHEVKAITYHGLKVVPDGEGWLAEVILDI